MDTGARCDLYDMAINRESKFYRDLTRTLEALFLALTGVYVVFRLSKSTTFRVNWPGQFETFLMICLGAVALVRLLMSKPRWPQTPVAVAMVLIYGMVYRADGYSFLLFLAILTVGFIDIDYRKILKTYVAAAGAFYCVTILAGLMGVITNYVVARAGRGVRSAWGMSYYTDFASLGLFILMMLWAAWSALPDWTMLIFCAGYMLLSHCIAHSNTSTICAALLFCAILYHILERRVIDRQPGLRWIKRVPELFAVYGFPLLALVMFALMLLYARGLNIGYTLNNLLSNRLHHSVNAWKDYGLTPFGTPFQQHGGGFSTFPSNIYNFVDSTYPLILIRYGWVTLLALSLSWGWTARKVIRAADRRLMLVMCIIAVHAFSEHHFIDSHFNILVAMPLAAYLPVKGGEAVSEGEQAGKARDNVISWSVTALLFIAAACLAGPALLSWMKTALEYHGLGHGEHWLRLTVVLAGVLFGVCLAAWSVSRLVKSLLTHAGPRAWRPAAMALLVCALAGGCVWLYADRTIDAAVRDNEAMVEADREALEIAVREATGRVYSGVLPAAYRREIEGISYAAFFEDDLSRLHGNTVLMPSDAERGAFIHNGFLYVPVSDAHALYTADRAVVDALAGAGYHPTGYYSSVGTVDLADAADRNELIYDPQAGLRMDVDDEAMRKGPWKDLYGGKYTATFELSIPEGANRDDGRVCTLRVTTFKGDIVAEEQEIHAGQFDGQGKLNASLSFNIPDSRNVAFEAWAAPGRKADIARISYVRTPDYDVHTFYDGKLRKTRCEYYSLDGERKLRKEGWFACDYDYDRYGNVNSIRYYDCEGRPTLINAGYAQRKRVFDARGQITREALYGTDGQLIMGSSDYAVNEREYDDAGNAVVQRYYDTDGQPTLIAKGYAEVRRDYDERRRLIRERYFGVDGRPIALSKGECAVEFEYDGKGNKTTVRYLDGEGRPMITARGYAELRRRYNSRKKVIREEYRGADGELIMLRGKYAVVETEYDSGGKPTVKRYYDIHGALVKETAGGKTS